MCMPCFCPIFHIWLQHRKLWEFGFKIVKPFWCEILPLYGLKITPRCCGTDSQDHKPVLKLHHIQPVSPTAHLPSFGHVSQKFSYCGAQFQAILGSSRHKLFLGSSESPKKKSNSISDSKKNCSAEQLRCCCGFMVHSRQEDTPCGMEKQNLWPNTAACGASVCAHPQSCATLRSIHRSGGGGGDLAYYPTEWSKMMNSKVGKHPISYFEVFCANTPEEGTWRLRLPLA